MSDVVEVTSSFQPRFVKVASKHLKWFKHVLGKDEARHEEKFQVRPLRVPWLQSGCVDLTAPCCGDRSSSECIGRSK